MILNIEHIRYGFGRKSTLSRLLVEGEHQCFALEDERRNRKVMGETCIPLGRYEIKLRTEGGMSEDYRRRVGDLHKGMLWLQEVPGFEWVYYHIGNKETETNGCPLTGTVPLLLPDGEFEVARSKDAYLALYKRVVPVLLGGGKVYTHVTEARPL